MAEEKGYIVWRCRCDCGKETLATESNLVNGTRKSCGCLRKENQEKIGERLHRVDGSCIEFLEKRKYRKDNKSGFRGVYQLPNGRRKIRSGLNGPGWKQRESKKQRKKNCLETECFNQGQKRLSEPLLPLVFF